MANDERILVLMPTAKDGERTRKGLAEAGLECVVCSNLSALCHEISQGAGVALLTEEAIIRDRERCLQQVLQSQPTWSDFALVVLAREGSGGARLRESMNATLIDRPVKFRSLLSVCKQRFVQDGTSTQFVTIWQSVSGRPKSCERARCGCEE